MCAVGNFVGWETRHSVWQFIKRFVNALFVSIFVYTVAWLVSTAIFHFYVPITNLR